MSAFLFFSIQLLSIVVAVAVLTEYRRVCRQRAEFFLRLRSSAAGKRMGVTLVALYLVSFLLVLSVSSYVFFLQF